MPCVCANKAQDQVYYNKRIDEEISEWLKDVPVHSIECSNTKKRRETVIKKLQKTLKQLPNDENFDDNARNEIKSFVDNFSLWNPGKDKEDEKLFKNQLADKLIERIVGIPRKPDRFSDIVKKWVVNMDFEDNGEDVDKETIISKFVNKLKSLAAERPTCDIKYTNILRKEIIELLVELALKFDGDMIMLKNIANKLATEIVSIPRNVNLPGDTTDLSDEFEENMSDWICEHGLCGELNKDPKLIEGLAKKLNKLKSHGINDEYIVEKMKDEIHQFVDDVSIAIETMDQLVDELMKELSNTVQTDEMERQKQQNNDKMLIGQDELTEEVIDWLRNLSSGSDLHPRIFEKIIKELVNVIKEGREQGSEDLTNDILNCLVDADLPIGPDDLGTHVEELMEKLNILPSDKYRREQAKKVMLKDICDVIENMSISEDKKAELRKKAHEIVEKQLNESFLNFKGGHNDVEEAVMDNMDVFISSIDIPTESLFKLKTSLSNTLNNILDESLTRLRRLSRDVTNLKQRIAKDVRNAVMELPIDTDKKKDLIQQVKGTLPKNMHKPLPSNIKNTINNEISDIVDRCPISEDNSIEGCLKKMLSAVASKHLNICLPKCVCDIKNKLEKDIGIVIDRSSIDAGKQKELKKKIQDILTENEDRHLSDEVLSTIKKDINGVVGDLSIPQDKKDVLKKIVGETISKDFNEALSNLRHDLNKIRNKLFQDICNVIEKSPISEVVKKHLINNLKSILARNLDSSILDEDTILDEVSNIVKEDIPEEKRRSLTNKLAKKLDTQQRKEDTNEIDQLTKNLKELEKKILVYILREMEQAVEEAPIPRERKIELKRKLKDMATIDYRKTAEDVAEEVTNGINEILDELYLPKDKKNELKSELETAIDEYRKLLRDIQDLETENGEHKRLIQEIDEKNAKGSILQKIEDIITEPAIPEEKMKELKRKLRKMATDLKNSIGDDVQDAIKFGIADTLDELQIPKSEKDKLKRALINMADENLDKLREAKQPADEVDETKAKECILQGIEKIIEESAIPEEKTTELRGKLKKMAVDNLKVPFSNDVKDVIKFGIADTLDEQQIPKYEKDKLKRALINTADENLDKLREVKQPVDEDDEAKANESILRGIEKIIDESAIPEEKKMNLKRNLKKMAVDNLKQRFSDDVQDGIKFGIADILDEQQILKSEKDKLKRALINMTDENLDKLREAKQPVDEVDETNAKESILQGIEKITDESAIPEEKKKELKRKLKKMAVDNLKKPFSEDVQDAIKIGIADILDELQIPKSEKEKLKRALINMADENLDKLREAKQLADEVDETNAKESILQGIEKITDESAIPEEKKKELKRKLKKMAVDNLKKPFSEDVQDAIKIGIADILDELQIPKSEKDKLKRALINMADENLDKLREAKQPADEVDETNAKESILQGIEKITDESAIPEEKKKELKRKLKKMAVDNLKKPFSEDVQDAIKIGIADILDELQIPKSEKEKLKRALINMADENLDKLREAKQPADEVDETNAKESILQGIEKITNESAIPEEKKKELKRKLKKMAVDNLKKPFGEDVQYAIKIGIADILDELQIPKSEKDKLKRALLNMADENLVKLREEKQPVEEVDKKKANESILQGIEKIIEESAIPEEKKKELKRKMKKMAVDNLKNSFSHDVQDAIKFGIADTLDEQQIPIPEKNKLKRALINMDDKNSTNLQDVDKTKAKESILQGIEDITEVSAIPEEKKKELKRKLKKMAVDNLKKPFSDDVRDAIKIGIADILDELQIPKSEKDKLKRALLNMADENLANLRNVDKTKAKESILQGIEDITEVSAIPEEKKKELKRKLKKMVVDNLKKPFSDEVQNAIKIGIADTLDELQIPKSEKDKLKRALLNMADENLANLRDVDKTKAKESILQGIEDITEVSAIPEEKKKELKRKLKKMAVDNLKKPFSDDVQDAIKIGIADILDELQIPKSEKDKLKRALINMADENLDKLREAKQPVDEAYETKAKESILQGIEKITEESAIPEEKKKELKRKLKKMAVDNLKKPFSEDVQDAIKIGIADILDELQIPKSEKDKLKRALINMADENLDKLREAKQPVDEAYETKAKESIMQGIEKIITESAIPEDKKVELKRKLKKMASCNLKKPFSDDMQDAIKIGIADTLDELQIPKSEKDKLKRALLNMAEGNLAKLREAKQSVEEVDETKAKESILQGIEKIITESAIPEGKKMELKRKLKKMATDHLKKPLSDDVQDAIKISIADILDELQIPTSEKKKLKRALINMTDDYLDNLGETKQVKLSKGLMPIEEVDEINTKESILQGIEKLIEESAIPENEKMELNRKLKKNAVGNLKKPFTDDVHDAMKIGIVDILDELQIPNSEKKILKRALLNMVDENVDNLRGVTPKLSSQVDDFKEFENETLNNILLGLEKAIDEAPIPIDKKKELKKKLKDLATKNYQKSLSDDTAAALKDGAYEILDELNLPKDKKHKLKSELTAAADENLSYFKNDLAKSMPDAKRHKLNVIIRRVLPQFDEAVDPSYQKQLAEEFDELLEIAGTDGDFKDARRKLIKKLMREQNLSEKEASGPVDELIGRAREMALREDIGDESYELDPSYVKTLEADINGLVNIAQVGGDFEEARRKLTKKLMREQNLPEEKASACADELIGKAQKLALAAQSKDKSLLHKEALAKAISDAVDQSTLSKPDKNNLKNKLLSELKQTVDQIRFINKEDLKPLKFGVLQDLKKLVDASSIPTDKKNELKSLLNEELANTIDRIMDEYDVEEGYTKSYTKAISKAVNKSPLPNLQKCNLKKALAKVFDGTLDDGDDDKITKDKEAFSKLAVLAKAINDAVDLSTLSKPDKSSIKNKLLKRMNQTVDESPHINDTSALKAEVLKDCKSLVDTSSIPTGKKNELKLLLEEEIMDDYDDKAVYKSPERLREDKLKKYKEAFVGAINDAVSQSSLSKPDKSSQKNKLLSKLNQIIDNSPHLHDIVALTDEVLKGGKKVVDTSSIPIDKKTELKLLLEEAMTETAKELMNDEEVSQEAFAIFKDKLAEIVKTWMDSLPIDLDPKVATAAATDLASDILDRQKYLQLHPEAISTDKDEIENLKYQIFRRMKTLVDSKDMPRSMEGAEELHRMVMEIEPPPGFPKLREQSTSERRRKDPVPQDIDGKKSISTTLSNGNINYSLKELIATSKSIRRQWSKNIDEAITKLPLPTNEKCFLKEKLAIYEETDQINRLSAKSKEKEETRTVQVTKSKKPVALKSAQVASKVAQIVPKTAQKNNKGKPSSRFSKIEKALTFNNTTKQKSPFTPKSNQGGNEKEFAKFTTNTINAWLDKVQVNIEPKAKTRIVEDLTRDIVHRKIYLQIYGSAEPSRSDDLENLKLQVHRRLNEFVPAEALKAVIIDTKQLLAKIDTFKIKFSPESANKPKSTVSQKTDKKQGIAGILDVKGKATNTPMNGDEEEMEQELSNTEFCPGQTSTPGRPNGEPTAEENKIIVAEYIRTWIESMPIDLETDAKTDFIDDLTNDIVDRNKYLQVQPDKTISKKEEIENLRFQVYKRLIKADPDASKIPDIEKVEELYKMIGHGRRKSLTPKQTEEFLTALNEEISAILDDYYIGCDRRELHPSLVNELKKLGKSNADQDEIVENLIETIKRLTHMSSCVCDEEAEELAHKLLYRTKKLIARIQEKYTPVKKKDFKEAMMQDIGDVFSGCPMSKEKRKLMESQLAEEYAKDLGIPLEDSDVTMDGTGPESKKERYGMSFNGLTNFIDTWLSSIHTDDDTKREDEIKDMAYSLIHKIGEMNVDPEIFNDDSLYEAVLRDELQNLLGDITISDNEIQALIKKVLEAQHRAHDEIAGQTYKRNLRDTISKLLPNQRNLSKEEQATIETLKDQLADAYIDLHYSGDNENQRERLKRKIVDEINNFCRDYMYRNPCSPLNSRTLNNNLYTALNKVPLPTGDSIRYEVEIARIREEINDWLKELPLQPQNPTEVFARNKLVYVLSKKLFDIEVEVDDTDNQVMKKEIVKFLNKMPLKSGENNDKLADKLIDKLKASEESRKYDASSNVTIDAFGNVRAASRASGMDAPMQPKPFPPCTLSPEDRAHLERIKQRTCLSPSCLSSFLRRNKCDAGVGPRSVDAGSQTLLRPFGMEKQQSPICPVNNEKTPRPCPGSSANLEHPYSHARRDPFEIEKPSPSPICPAAHEKTPRPNPAEPSRPPPQSGHQMRRHTISSSNIAYPRPDVQPQVIIKQYYWNPNEKNSIVDESDLQKSGSSRRQSDPVPCHQPGRPSFHQTGSAPCDQTRTSSYAQSTPAPYGHPSLGKLQQNTSPQRMPCDQSFTCPEPKSQHQPSPERYSYWDPQRSFQRPSQRDIPSTRSSYTPSPCMSPFGLNQQSSPPGSPGFPKRDHECQMPKRDGLQDQMPCSSRPCRKERVIELGSLDDISNARPKKRHSDQSDWPFQEDNFWGVPMRRVILDEGINESVVMEREQREERIRCRCKERLIPKSGRSQPRTCPSQEIPLGNEDEQNLQRCSKCCGRQCPYPSFLYFRQ